MSEDLTKTLTVKRSTKKKSGYTVSEKDSVYYLENAPTKARVNPGDRVVGINGIPADEFLDEDDANDLIESIRIVVVPKDKLDEYDGIQEEEEEEEEDDDDEEEEEYEEYDRTRSKKPNSNNSTAIVPTGIPETILGKGSIEPISRCIHCDHVNEDLSVDEDGDLVCEECGHVIEPPPSENDAIHTCAHCDHENMNLEPDEDGDLVCEECGHVIPEENALVVSDDTDTICEHCEHVNENLEPDEDGDLVCEECGHVIEPPSTGGATIYTCIHCDQSNENLEPDEDGDLVCEECGHVIEPPPSENDVIHTCAHCDHENKNLERDDEGDLVCQECGHVIPEEDLDLPKDEQNPKEIIYECPDCEHKNLNPEPDEEGDRVCEECGCVLPEKEKYECESCKHENIDPEQNKDGDYPCENCGSVLDVEEKNKKTGAEKLKEIADNDDDDNSDVSGGGQQFDEKGKPTTNPDGKKLTPADMFSPGDVITVTVGKSNPKQDPGLKVEEMNGKYYVRKVPSGGLFARTPVIAGDKILELNGIDSHEFKNVNGLKKILKDESKITVMVLRKDPEASESSASSVDYDELKAIKPNGLTSAETTSSGKGIEEKEDDDETRGIGEKEDDDETREKEDDDTAPYNCEDCGCIWCPDCHE